MQRNVAIAHAGSIRSFAQTFRHDDAEGASEVAFLLDRAAKLVDRIAEGLPAVEPTVESESHFREDNAA